MMKKKLLLLVAMLLPLVASADDAIIEGIYYSLNSIEKTATVYRYNAYIEKIPKFNVIIPESITYNAVTYSVTRIYDNAFERSNLISISIPNSVTYIGHGAFYNCYSLVSVTIGNGVKAVGSEAFYSCSSLQKVIVKDIAAWCGISFQNV